MRGKAGLAGAITLLVAAVGSQLGPDTSGMGLGLLDQSIAARPLIEKYRADELEPPVGLAWQYRRGNMPPVLNQGDTPRCVAFSSSTVKAWQDYREHGRFYNFDEATFARRIGTTASGAYMANAVAEMQIDGYPVMYTGNASRHRIRSYWHVTKSASAIKQAVATYGPILVLSPWYASWFHPRSNGVLPRPDRVFGGHAFVVYGWDNDRGLRIRNSWGAKWGLRGDAFMPYQYVDLIYGAYVTIDAPAVPAPDPTPKPTPKPTVTPTPRPTASPAVTPSAAPVGGASPTPKRTKPPKASPSIAPTVAPTIAPAPSPTALPTPVRTASVQPTARPGAPATPRGGATPLLLVLILLGGAGALFYVYGRRK